jgi:DNA-binding GntR family transcriptional regulator
LSSVESEAEAVEGIALTLPERTAQLLRARILAQTPGYEPGERLLLARLSADLGVSITPIREALKSLDSDGLVVTTPRLGVRVANPSEQDLLDLLVVQEGMEILALQLAADTAPIEELREAFVQGLAALEGGDIARCRALSTTFHRHLVRRSGNGPLAELYAVLLARAQILDVFYPRERLDIEASIEEHRRLLDSLERGSRLEVELALRNHWAGTRERLRSTLRDRSSSVA